MDKLVLQGDNAVKLWLEGKDTWNKWTEENPEADVDFSEVDFGKIRENEKLKGISFHGFHFPTGYVDFSRTHFGEGFVDFCDTSFSGEVVSFIDASFGEGNVSFFCASFGGGIVRFTNASFGKGDVTFSNASFGKGDVLFASARFGEGNVDFTDASFGEGEVSFKGASFGEGSVDFSCASFSGGSVDFSYASFSGGNVSFPATSFGKGNVSFSYATFGEGDVLFASARFGEGDATFDSATFGEGDVAFDSATFGEGDVTFPNASFGKGDVSFDGAGFGKGNVSFSSASFGKGNVSFSYATFGEGDVFFVSTRFGDGNVSFDRAKIIAGNINLSKIETNGSLDFTKFKGVENVTRLSFQHASLNDSLILPTGKFDCVPDLRNSKIAKQITFHEMKPSLKRHREGRRKLWRREATDPEDASRLRRLKELAETNKDHKNALAYHADEMRAQRWVEIGFLPSVLDAAFSLTSNYGQSIIRPIIGWLIMNMGLFGFYSGSSDGNWLKAYEYTVANSLPFLLSGNAVRNAGLKALYPFKYPDNVPDIVNTLGFAQGTLTVIFLFLVGLGLRNRFRI